MAWQSAVVKKEQKKQRKKECDRVDRKGERGLAEVRRNKRMLLHRSLTLVPETIG